MSSLDKLLSIITFFDDDHLSLDVGDVVKLTGLSRASCYRYLQSLTRAGLLSPAIGGRYTIGSRVLELSRLQRENDPLLRAAHHKIRYYSQEHKLNILLCSFYGNKVICTDNAWASGTVPEIYHPGRALPIFRGAMGKSILAHFSNAQLGSIYRHNTETIAECGLGDTLQEFQKSMAELRKQQVVVTRGEVVPDLVGIAHPLLNDEHVVAGSVIVVASAHEIDEERIERFKSQVTELSASIDADLASLAPVSEQGRTTPAPSRIPIFQ